MCHQTVSLVAQHLESQGLPTVIVGSAQDIVEVAGVPRFVFVDYPLGNPAGRPGDTAEQLLILRSAITMLGNAFAPRTTQRLELSWPTNDWRANFMHVGADNAAELAEAGRLRREIQAAAKH